MRKVLVLLAILMLPLIAAQAQDKSSSQAPIFAIAEGKLYRVSAEDGSATLMADTASDQIIAPLRVESISPDGKYLVYILQSTFDTKNTYKNDLFLVTIADGTTQTISPTGGLFDIPATKDERFVLDMATWSYDSQRVYYYRSTYSVRATGVNKPVLFAYYDMATGKHQLVARIDPKNLLDNLQGVSEGIATRWYQPGAASSTIITLYGMDNQITNQSEINVPYLHALRDKEDTYYVQLKDFGDIDFKVGAYSGIQETVDSGYYPAAQSLANGENSMHVFSVQSDINTFYIYGADYHTYIMSINNKSGFNYALAPDGQSMAYMKFENELRAPIQIMDMKGNIRTLDFKAEQILWGGTEFVFFYAPG